MVNAFVSKTDTFQNRCTWVYPKFHICTPPYQTYQCSIGNMLEMWYEIIFKTKNCKVWTLMVWICLGWFFEYTMEDERLEPTAITHLERKMIFQTSMIMFHVNLQGCRLAIFWFFVLQNSFFTEKVFQIPNEIPGGNSSLKKWHGRYYLDYRKPF